MKRKKYKMTEKRKAEDMKKRVATAKRNVAIYLLVMDGKWRQAMADYHMTYQRVYAIKRQVTGMILRGEVDISLFE